MPPSNQKPSSYSGDYWIVTHGPAAVPHAADVGGKWLLFVDRDNIDEVWEKIRIAVEAGRLGTSAKVSTALPNPLSRQRHKHVVCVFTYDADDEDDVKRVRQELRKLGFEAPIAYKTNKATLEREYSQPKGKVAKYFE